MTIVCGTDFTPGAEAAVRSAANLAVMRREELVLTHVLHFPTDSLPADKQAAAKLRKISEQLEELRAHLRELLAEQVAKLAQPDLSVRSELLDGAPDEALVGFSERVGASLVVLGALGRRSTSLWRLGSTADRIAQVSRRPVWIARDDKPFAAWRARSRALRALIGLDFTPTSDAAVGWSAKLAHTGGARCELVGAHVFWPPAELERQRASEKGAKRQSSEIAIGSGHPEVQQRLERELRARVEPLLEGHAMTLSIIGGLGRPADHIVQCAREQNADLIVVGTHQRGGLTRFWHGSVSQNVIALAPQSVVCVPSRS